MNRAAVYGILARLYDRPLTPEFKSELSGVDFFALLSQGRTGRALARINDPDLDAEAVEHTRLFVGPGPPAPPYASIYRQDDERTGELWGSSTGEMQRYMRHHGLSVSQSGLIPDHISILFEFMERVIAAGAEAGENRKPEAQAEAERIQREFFADYIHAWVYIFLARVRAARPQPFYAALVDFTQAFMEEEGGLLLG